MRGEAGGEGRGRPGSGRGRGIVGIAALVAPPRGTGAALAVLVGLVLAAAALHPAQGQGVSHATPVTCRIGVNIEDLYDLDMARDTFGAIFWIWSLCPTDAVKPLETITFTTASSGPSLSAVETDELASGDHYASRRVQGTFRYNWNMDHYPFDRQEVVIPIDEAQYTARRLLFEPDTRDSFLTPEIRKHLDEWRVSDLALQAGVGEAASTYGLPDPEEARYARLEARFTLERAQYVPFFKLTSGVFAGVFIAFLSFFYDPNDRGGFGGKLGLLVGVLFAVLVNLRTADASIGDAGDLTLVTEIHLVTLAIIVILALVALRDRRRVERGLQVPHPDWPMLAGVGSLYALVVGGLIVRAAWS
jgi:hypothetical protein